MKQYHISPRSGRVSECSARVRSCPFGDSPHYGTRQEAQAHLEAEHAKHTFSSFRPGNISVSGLPYTMRVNANMVRVKKGVYFIGDPQLALGNDQTTLDLWKSTAESESAAARGNAVGACYNDFPVVALRTGAGEGNFVDSDGRVYPVESGYVAVVPMSLIRRMGVSSTDLEGNGTIVTFDKVTSIESREGGELSFGRKLKLYTEEDAYSDEINMDELFAAYGIEDPMKDHPLRRPDGTIPLPGDDDYVEDYGDDYSPDDPGDELPRARAISDTWSD